ncbi:MAG: hypothetical protein FJ304_14910 [Planctomycetes bacterium]|nr:hypothetical protein [Planctomycetota bacterium]
MAAPASRPRARVPVLAAAVLAVLAPAARADAEKLVPLRAEWHAHNARFEAAEDEAKRIAPPRAGGASVRNFQDPSAILGELRPVLTDDYKAVRNAALKLAGTARARRDEARKDWEDLYRQRVEFRQHVEKQQGVYGFDFDSGARAAFRPTLFDAGVVVWAAVVFAVAVRLGRNARRVSIRRAQRALAAAVLVGLLGATGCAPGPNQNAGPWAAREEAKLTAEVKDATEKADAADAAANKKWAASLDAWAALVSATGAGGDTVETILRDGETDLRAHLRAASTDARLAERFATEAEAERAALAADKAKLDDLVAGSKWRAVGFAAARCAAVVVLFGLAIAPYRRARRKEAALVKADAKKCPRCFSEKLVIEQDGVVPDAPAEAEEEEEDAPSLYRSRGKAKAKAKPKAKSRTPVASGPKETGYVECKACSFRFLRSYQKVRRLCFPVVGVRSSGKTHMLATGYNLVRMHTAPTVAVIQPAPSLGDARFEQYIDLILRMRREAGGTVHDVLNPPDPVMMHVRDADPAGANTALVNLFDYSGELVNQAIDKDRLKKQAVKMDGFMLFLDPTQLYGDGTNVTLDRQLAALNEFMADMRETRDVPVGRPIPVPVAVCIPKFDLLLTENPIQGQSVPYIRQILADLNPTPPRRTSLKTIRGRSEIVEEMLELMFRGVDVRALVESYFGPQVMFFPVSSVSLLENELGIRDLSMRTLAPFGVAEPFLWLLHMHGYEVFSTERDQRRPTRRATEVTEYVEEE